jgi:hypothetical protein
MAPMNPKSVLAFLICLVLCLPIASGQIAKERTVCSPQETLVDKKTKEVPSRTILTKEEEALIRKLVYEETAILVHPLEGKYALLELLYVPDEITEIYKKCPVGTLGLLLKIIEGGNPKDAMLAAGYALAIAEDPVTGAICTRGRRDSFDQVIKNSRKSNTTRNHWANEVGGLLDKASKQSNNK